VACTKPVDLGHTCAIEAMIDDVLGVPRKYMRLKAEPDN
jgi:hypothetical protein